LPQRVGIVKNAWPQHDGLAPSLLAERLKQCILRQFAPGIHVAASRGCFKGGGFGQRRAMRQVGVAVHRQRADAHHPFDTSHCHGAQHGAGAFYGGRVLGGVVARECGGGMHHHVAAAQRLGQVMGLGQINTCDVDLSGLVGRAVWATRACQQLHGVPGCNQGLNHMSAQETRAARQCHPHGVGTLLTDNGLPVAFGLSSWRMAIFTKSRVARFG
jgi:hypothetical protein